jgi:hypothetical protein
MSGGRAGRAVPVRLLFGVGAVAGLLGALLLGWLTTLRGVMHALLVTLGAHALVPFLIVLALIAIAAGSTLASTLLVGESGSGAAASPASPGGHGRFVAAYLAYLRRQHRHPFAWGLSAGLGLGVIGIWLVLAALVVPLETRTLSALLLARVRIDAARAGATPPAPPAPHEPLRASAWSTTASAWRPEISPSSPEISPWSPAPSEGSDAPVLDAFGHAISYESREAPGGYTLHSLGLDGVASRDDLCVHGGAALDARAPVRDPIQFVEALRENQLGWPRQIEAIARARCAD